MDILHQADAEWAAAAVKAEHDMAAQNTYVNDAGVVGIPIADLQRRHVLPIISIRGVYIQRNQVGLMIDAAACIVGDKPGEAQITFV